MDVTFSEGASQVRHHSPVVVSGPRGLARATPPGRWAGIAGG
ncbi:hypothetical protein [Streptomyces sp. NPDC047043]